MSEIMRLCYICGMKPATHTCKMCGRAACNDDFDLKLGICNSCKHGRTVVKNS